MKTVINKKLYIHFELKQYGNTPIGNLICVNYYNERMNHFEESLNRNIFFICE